MKRRLLCLVLILMLAVGLMTTAAAEDAVTLPDAGAAYSRQERSADAYLEYITYNPKTGGTFWLISKDGFSESAVQSISAIIYGLDDAAIQTEAVVRDPSAETPVYDVRVDLPAGMAYSSGR